MVPTPAWGTVRGDGRQGSGPVFVAGNLVNRPIISGGTLIAAGLVLHAGTVEDRENSS